jgi:hypothetical protein
MSALGQKRTWRGQILMSAIPLKADIRPRDQDVRFGPCVDGSELARFFSRTQHWSVQPCVRPLSAVHMTAGHNALRGSGPGQKRAFDNAVAHVGCPDRRIDRLCITWVAPPNRGSLNQRPHLWHSRAGGGAVHSIISRHREAAGVFAEAVIRSVELIVQPAAKDVVGEMGVRRHSPGESGNSKGRRGVDRP